MAKIAHQWVHGIYILYCIKWSNEGVEFWECEKWFDQDEELSKNYELFGSLLVVDDKHSVVVIIT